MAPRSHGGQQDTSRCVTDGSNLPSVGFGVTRPTKGDRGVLSANTGAGINARCSTSTIYRGRDGSGHNHRRQRTTQVHRGFVGPRSQNGGVGRHHDHVRPDNDDNFRDSSASRTSTGTINTSTSLASSIRSPSILPIRRVNSCPGHLSTTLSGPRLTRILPESQRRLDPMSPAGLESSFTVLQKPIRKPNTLPSISKATTANANSSGAPNPTDSINGQIYA
ncbi:hypothetical protein AA0114_g11820 [Alternaria tenuissima]|uniref:Uncharacterized protein n=1 Tax=Alternaria tenuissima TaxID=119927 RepID=A0A4Q4M1G7_9PLEO|nr:hypothetical protein AA0114_g11820 [Alternaria tenuissima]